MFAIYTNSFILLLLLHPILMNTNNCHREFVREYYGDYDDEYDVKMISICTYKMIYNPHSFKLWPNYDDISDDIIKDIKIQINSSLIMKIQRDTFENVADINEFAIDKSQVLEMDPGAFKDFTNLKVLRLLDNNLTALGSGLFPEKNLLERLELQHNGINKLDAYAFENLYKLLHLDLSFNKITTLNNSLIFLTHLKYINLEHNNIYKLESYLFKSMDFLEVILLSSNEITSVETRALTNLEQLKNINLSNNYINSIERDSFHSIQIIETLNISNTNLKNISFIQNIPTLKMLILQNNSITEIEKMKMENLSTLLLTSNKIQVIREGCFEYMKQLNKLDLSENMITTINTGTFSGLHSLQYLNISRNQIKTIKGFPFHNTPKIEYLDASRNELKQIDISELTNLKILSIENNNFTCPTLNEIISKLKSTNATLVSGNSYEGNSIRGISCEDVDGNIKTSNSLEDYFEHGFRNSYFVNYFENRLRTDSENNRTIAEMSGLFRNLINATLEINAAVKSGWEIIMNKFNSLESINQQILDNINIKARLYEKRQFQLEKVVDLLNQTKKSDEKMFIHGMKSTQNDFPIDSLVQINKNLQMLAIIGVVTIVFLGLFMAILIYFKCRKAPQKISNDNSEMQRIV